MTTATFDKPGHESSAHESPTVRFSSIVVAAGRGARLGSETPKQWLPLAGKPLARWSLEALLAAGSQEVIVVIGAGQEAYAAAAFAGLTGWRAVIGGAERTDSVRAGLAALAPSPPEAVLVHDAARPFVTLAHVQALLAALTHAQGAVPALPLADTVKRADASRVVQATVDRTDLWRAQTPQAFHHGALVVAYAAWTGGGATDDAAVLEAAGGRVALTPGDARLMKVTYPEDVAMAEMLARSQAEPQPARVTRMGVGLDAHVFGPGSSVWLCGVEIPHAQALVGHSDADAGLHALTDAILGAVAMGDIGDHFPPTDPQWKGAPSDTFLRHAVGLVEAAGGRLVNVDVTLVCERPKVKPHREAMRARIAEITGLPLSRVSVKATTMERMGFTGREEGLAAQACAVVDMPA